MTQIILFGYAKLARSMAGLTSSKEKETQAGPLPFYDE